MFSAWLRLIGGVVGLSLTLIASLTWLLASEVPVFVALNPGWEALEFSMVLMILWFLGVWLLYRSWRFCGRTTAQGWMALRQQSPAVEKVSLLFERWFFDWRVILAVWIVFILGMTIIYCFSMKRDVAIVIVPLHLFCGVALPVMVRVMAKDYEAKIQAKNQ